MEDQFDEKAPEVQEVKCLTTKELKALARPEFEANPDKFYPTKVFEAIGFTRNRCPKCKAYYWRASEERDTCGDSNCIGKYTFIGKGAVPSRETPMTYAEAWDTYK